MTETLNNTPLLLLRQNNKQFKQKQRLLNKRVKDKKHLRQQIYSNHNIFQSSVNLYRNMTAQNIIWDKNYNYKCMINQVKEENSSLKARIWNVEKENRRMERQINSWNLADYAANTLTKKPYIDMGTVEKVVGDQDYNIVSMKMQIFQLEKQLKQREEAYQMIVERNKETPKLISLLNHEIAMKKIGVCECIQIENNHTTQFQKNSKEKMSMSILKLNQQLDLIAKNIEIKKKSKVNIENDLQSVINECELQKNITYTEIQRLNQQTRRMKAEEDGGLNLQRERLKMSKKSNIDYQCYMQTEMGNFIKIKIPLQLQLQKLKNQLGL